MVTVFADGSAWRGEGGAGIVLLYEGGVIVRQGIYLGRACTNQRAELAAAIHALEQLPARAEIRLVSDSAYLINGMNEAWHERWEENGWRTSGKKPVANRTEWVWLANLDAIHRVTWEHVRGHGRGGVTGPLRRYNEIADRLAHVARVERRTWFNRVERGRR